jgi:hypothetical protein
MPNLIAMEIAGLGRTGLYAGSWSDWCSDPEAPGGARLRLSRRRHTPKKKPPGTQPGGFF